MSTKDEEFKRSLIQQLEQTEYGANLTESERNNYVTELIRLSQEIMSEFITKSEERK